MQSEYPLSVLIVVPPWPGPVGQNPEPTTPTGPPRPAAAAAATLSRYQGYIECPAEYHRFFPIPLSLSLPNLARPEFQANIHSRSHVTFFSLFLFFSVFLPSVYLFAIRTRHAVRDTHLTADGITAPRTARYRRGTRRARAQRQRSAFVPRVNFPWAGERSLAFAYVYDGPGIAHSR